jgi:peroxiredoxin
LQRRFPDELLVVSITRLYGAISQAAELEQINKFMDKHGVRHPVLVADKETNITNYRVQTLPTAVLVGRDGRVINYWVGDRGVDDAIKETEALLGGTAADLLPEKVW